MIDINKEFTAKIRKYSGKITWHFVTLPLELAELIKSFNKKQVGFKTVKVEVMIGDSMWRTSLFPDRKSASYLLAIKADIRKAENITADDDVKVVILKCDGYCIF